MRASKRQAEIMRTLRIGAITKISYLAEKFHVSERTIRRDIVVLIANHFPIITVQGCCGGVMLMDHVNPHRDIFTWEQNESLREMHETASAKHQKVIAELLNSYGKPFTNLEEF